MRELHESELFYCKKNNGVFMNQIPADVHSFKVHRGLNNVREFFSGKVYYFKDNEILEITLKSGESRFFQYRALKNRFVEVDASDVYR